MTFNKLSSSTWSRLNLNGIKISICTNQICFMHRTRRTFSTFLQLEREINSLWCSRNRQDAIKKAQELHLSLSPHVIKDYVSEIITNYYYHEKLYAMSRLYLEEIVQNKNFDRRPKEFSYRVLKKLSRIWTESNSIAVDPVLDEKVDCLEENLVFDPLVYDHMSHVINPHLKTIPKRHIVIGDVHGCFDELERLLKKVNFDSTQDQLVFVGDLIGKGPHSLRVIQLVRKFGSICVKGNHENYLLQHWISKSLGENPVFELIPSYQAIADEMSEDDWAWMLTLDYTYEFENRIVVHAGLVPGVSLEDQNPHDMMNMRNFHEGTGTSRTDLGTPWTQHYIGQHVGKDVVFGHDATKGLQICDHALGLDTGCVYGGDLTAGVFTGGGSLEGIYRVDSDIVYHEKGKKYY
jgi:hypothetical protein